MKKTNNEKTWKKVSIKKDIVKFRKYVFDGGLEKSQKAYSMGGAELKGDDGHAPLNDISIKQIRSIRVDFGGDVQPWLQEALKFPLLTRLFINDCHGSNADTWEGIGKLQNLEVLHIQDSTSLNQAAVNEISKLGKLSVLKIELGCFTEDVDFSVLEAKENLAIWITGTQEKKITEEIEPNCHKQTDGQLFLLNLSPVHTQANISFIELMVRKTRFFLFDFERPEEMTSSILGHKKKQMIYNAPMTASEIRNTVAEMKKRPAGIIINYLQLIKYEEGLNDQDAEQDILKTLSSMAMDFKIPVIVFVMEKLHSLESWIYAHLNE